MKKKNKKSFWKDVRAVSPVIGVILMVAVTVVMAAIIMSWSSGITAPETPRQCGVTVSRLDPSNVSITVTSREPTQEYIISIDYSGYLNGTISNAEVMNKGTEATVLVGQVNTSVPHERGKHLVVTCMWVKDEKQTVLYDAVI